jgi:sugar phosphate isomerase/epimerase
MAHRFPLSAFADEVSPDLETQVEVLAKLGVQGFDLRSIENVNVLDLPDETLEKVVRLCHAKDLRMEAVGSPVNKVAYSPAAAKQEMEKLAKAIRIAKKIGAPRIRIFSPSVEQGKEEAMLPEVLAFLKDLAAMAQEGDVVLVHENDGHFLGAFPRYARRIFDEVGGPHFRAAYDFANGVPLGFRPMRDWFPWLLPHMVACHIKDSLSDGRVVPPGDGEGQFPETFTYLVKEGWKGTLTLEPHLKAGGPYGGTSGPELFEVAVRALRKVVRDAGGEC